MTALSGVGGPIGRLRRPMLNSAASNWSESRKKAAGVAMRKMVAALAIILGSVVAHGTGEAAGNINIGALSCHVSGGVGFIFGSSKDLACIFKRPNGETERYHGEINKYG